MADDALLRLLLRWVDQQSAAKMSITAGSLSFVGRLVRALAPGGLWYDQRSVDDAARRAAAASASAQRAMASTTQAYLDQVLAAMGAQRPRPRDVAPAPVSLRATPDELVWSRPAETYRYERSRGVDDETAIQRAVQRAEQIAATDINLAQREATRRHLTAVPEVRGYRRIIHPERSAGGTCGLCIAAADRLYFVSELLPLHGRCQCTQLPVVGSLDPGKRLNAADLERVYAEAGTTGAADLKATRYRVDEHGELGPVLTAAGSARRTPTRAAATATAKPNRDRVAEARQQRTVLAPVLADLEARSVAGEDVSAPLAYQRALLDKLDATIALAA